MITVELINDYELKLSFKYYKEYIDKMHELNAVYDKPSKSWTINKNKLKLLERKFEGELFFKTPKWKIQGGQPDDYSNLYTFNIDVNIDELGFKLKPFKYQEFGIKFTIDRLMNEKIALLCDDVGLGKTIEAIGTIKYLLDNNLAKDIAIVCKKSLKLQWKEEIEKFIDIDANVYIVEDIKSKRCKTYKKINLDKNKTITILNYHILLNDSKELKPNYIIFDECHTAKKYNGEINKACKKIASNSKYCLFMTGTPIMSRPEDIFGIISIKNKKYFGGTFSDFEDKYVVKVDYPYKHIVGYKNLDELRDKVQKLILRRTADEVDIDLPDIFEINCKIKIDEVQRKALDFVKEKSEYNQSCLLKIQDENKSDEYLENIKKLESIAKGYIAIEQIVANNPRLLHLSKSNKIRNSYKKYTPSGNYVSNKYLKLLDIVEELQSAGKKAIVFTKYETVVKHLCDYLYSKGIKSSAYYGVMNEDIRNKNVSEFKYDDSITCFIATDAGAEGLNLQFANTVIHFDLPFTDSIYTQRNGRARRAGSKYSKVIAYNLISEDTIDENIYKRMKDTKNTFDVFVSADEAQSKLLKQLSN